MRDIEALESAIDMLKLMFDTRHRDWYRHGHELSKLPEDDQVRDPGDSRRASLKHEALRLSLTGLALVIPAIRAGPH